MRAHGPRHIRQNPGSYASCLTLDFDPPGLAQAAARAFETALGDIAAAAAQPAAGGRLMAAALVAGWWVDEPGGAASDGEPTAAAAVAASLAVGGWRGWGSGAAAAYEGAVLSSSLTPRSFT